MSGECEGALSEARAAYDLRLAPGFRRLPVYGASRGDGVRNYQGAVTLVDHGDETLYEVDRWVKLHGMKRIAHGAAPSAEDAVWLAVGFLIGGGK